jgi:transposase-like protein
VLLNFLTKVYDKLKLNFPRTILTNKEEALINAIYKVFLDTNTIICIWHVNMNLMKKALLILRD